MKKSSHISILACFLFISTVAFSQDIIDSTINFVRIDHSLINKRDPNFYNYIENLSWKVSLSFEDETMLQASIDTIQSREMQPDIIIPFLVHRLNSISQRNSLGLWEPFRKYLIQTQGLSDVKYDQFLLKSINPDTLVTKIKIMKTHYRSNDDEVLQALVIRQCKRMRRHDPPTLNIPTDWLNQDQVSLLKYSRMKDDVAIDSLFNMIQNRNAPIIRNEVDECSVLMTYGSQASHKALEIILDSIAFKQFSKSGQEALLRLVTHRAILDFTAAEKLDLLKYLNTESVYKTVMKEFATKIAFMTSRITGEDWVKSLNRVGYRYDPIGNIILPIDTLPEKQ